MAKYSSFSLGKTLTQLLEKKFALYIGMLEDEVRRCAKKHIKEDNGGLVNSIWSAERSDKYSGQVVIDVPYAYYVNDGRGPIVPKNAKVLSNLGPKGSAHSGKGNWNTSTFTGERNWNSQNGHSPFVAKYADGFEGYHFVEEAMKNVADAIERGE